MMKLHIFFKLDKKIIGNEGLNCLKKIEVRNALKTKRSWILCFNMSKLWSTPKTKSCLIIFFKKNSLHQTQRIKKNSQKHPKKAQTHGVSGSACLAL
jgi:hypothetical protein